MRVVAAVLFLAACAYLGAGLFGSGSRQHTVTAAPGSIRQSAALEGIALRNEALFPACGGLPVEEGARVSAGKPLGQGGAQPVFAPESALCFTGSDGYEALSPSALQPFSLERVRALMDDTPAKADSAVCRLVYDFCWYYAAVTEQPCLLEIGETAQLLFSGMESPVSARLCAAETSGGSTALLLRIGTMRPEYLCLRKCSAELIFAEHSGLVIPASAVCSDSGGAEFVYILTAGKKERREVEILYTQGETSIVSLTGGADALREGESVLTDRGG